MTFGLTTQRAVKRVSAVLKLALVTSLAAMLATGPAVACTSFVLRSADGGAVYGRTMEFGFDLQSDVLVIPRKFTLSTMGADGKPGMSWTGKYAAVGMNALGLTSLTDGINERGLAGGLLYFPGFAGYADPAKADPAKSLAPWDFLSWALTNFATIAEVKAALSGLSVIDVKQPQMGFAPPLHFTLHDATGASLVIEPVDGVLKVYDNPLGVMTNSPTFDWHLTNLRNYIKTSPYGAPPLTVNGQTFKALGQGTGLLGVPGDPTPPSRFLRALGYALSARPVKGGIESVRLAEHIANNFDIPRGWVRDEAGKPPVDEEYTQWSTIADLQNVVYYVKSYDDPVLRSVDLKSFDLDAKDLAAAPLKSGLAAPAVVFPKK